LREKIIMISASDFKNGVNILVKGEPYQVMWFQNHKPGKGGAIIRVKLRHLKKSWIIERTFKPCEKFEKLSVIKRKKQFLYKNGISFNFMDISTYEQTDVSTEVLGKKSSFLSENLEVEATYLENELISIELPIIVEMVITEASPGVRGDSISNATKIAKLETGLDIRVPLFIKKGDKVKVDTRTGEYIERI
jgi:elongation factor P